MRALIVFDIVESIMYLAKRYKLTLSLLRISPSFMGTYSDSRKVRLYKDSGITMPKGTGLKLVITLAIGIIPYISDAPSNIMRRRRRRRRRRMMSQEGSRGDTRMRCEC